MMKSSVSMNRIGIMVGTGFADTDLVLKKLKKELAAGLETDSPREQIIAASALVDVMADVLAETWKSLAQLMDGLRHNANEEILQKRKQTPTLKM